MTDPAERYFRLAPGVDLFQLPDGSAAFRSDTVRLRLEGESAREFAERLAPLLAEWRSLAELAAALGVDPAGVAPHLDALVESKALVGSDHSSRREPEDALSPLLAALAEVGHPPESARLRLRALRVAIFGMEGHGAHLAALLARSGVGRLLLVDPFPNEVRGSALSAVPAPEDRRSRDEVVGDSLRSQVGTEVLVSGVERLTSDYVQEIAPGYDLLVGCFDRGFGAAHHWINRASLRHGVPCLFAESRVTRWLVGPLVVPGESACYMCYRMREIACADDFAEAFAYEEHLDRVRSPRLHERPVFPAATSFLASVLAMEVLKCLIPLVTPNLAGRILEFQPLTLASELHAVLQKADCPVCGRTPPARRQPRLEELSDGDPPADLARVGGSLVSGRTGVVLETWCGQPEAGEPPALRLHSAVLSNHLFRAKPGDGPALVGGKGLDREEARIGALGEAVERYSAEVWREEEVTRARRDELGGASMDPRELVLYAPEQYEHLPYAPYDGRNVLGWVPARSLVHGGSLLVPALAVFLSYAARTAEEWICGGSSNGLAAGPTLPDAVLSAVCEVLERDALMLTWFHRLPTRAVDPRSHPDERVAELVAAYARRGVEIRLNRLPTDHPVHVFSAVAVQRDGDGPAATLGLGVDPNPARAARKAILELAQVRSLVRHLMQPPEGPRRMDELAADPTRVTTLRDHALLYASPDSLPAFDFMLQTPVTPMAWHAAEPATPIEQLRWLVEDFRSRGREILYCNLTPPDMARLGLHTARAIVPGYQPIHFGAREPRLGGRRLHEFPRSLGFPPSPEGLNPYPHPLA